jgi:hypothetical protein
MRLKKSPMPAKIPRSRRKTVEASTLSNHHEYLRCAR